MRLLRHFCCSRHWASAPTAAVSPAEPSPACGARIAGSGVTAVRRNADAAVGVGAASVHQGDALGPVQAANAPDRQAGPAVASVMPRTPNCLVMAVARLAAGPVARVKDGHLHEAAVYGPMAVTAGPGRLKRSRKFELVVTARDSLQSPNAQNRSSEGVNEACEQHMPESRPSGWRQIRENSNWFPARCSLLPVRGRHRTGPRTCAANSAPVHSPFTHSPRAAARPQTKVCHAHHK